MTRSRQDVKSHEHPRPPDFGATAFARADNARVTAAALFGALLPDLSLYLLAGWHLLILGTDADTVFNVLYFSESWQAIFAVDNSFLIWGAALGLALWFGGSAWIAFAGAGLLHLALDFPLHNDDARVHFWPASDWRFISPVSYWDPNHYAGVVGPIEMLASLVCLAILWRRFVALVPRLLIAATGVMQLAPGLFWAFVFDG